MKTGSDELGMIGLAVMGRNMLLNMAEHGFVGGQRSRFHRRRRLAHLDQDLPAGSFPSQRSPLVMRCMRDHLMSASRAGMHGDALTAIVNFNVGSSLSHPNLSPEWIAILNG